MGCGSSTNRVDVAPGSPRKEAAAEGKEASEQPPSAAPDRSPKSSSPTASKPAAVRRPVRRKRKNMITGAKTGDVECLQQLLSEGANVNARGMWGTTPLIAACQYGFVEASLLLLTHQADISLVNEKGCSPLLHAAVEGLIPVVDKLLAAGASTHIRPGMLYNSTTDANQLLTPLLGSAINGHAQVLRLLLAADANMNETAVSAARYIDPSPEAFGLEPDAEPVSFAEELNNPGCEQTALMLATRYQHPEVVEVLLEAGCDIRASDSLGFTALMWACYNGDFTLANTLLDAGAQPAGLLTEQFEESLPANTSIFHLVARSGMVHTLIRLLRRRKRELAKRDGRRRSLAKRGKVEESDVFGSSSESLWQRASASDGEIHSDDSFPDMGAAGAPKTKSGPRRSLISSASPQAANALGQTPLHVLCGACGSGRNSAWGKARNTACSRGGIGEAGVWAEQFAVADSAQPSWAQSSGGDSGITEDAAECLKWSAIVADARNKGLGIYSVLSFARVLLSAGVDPLIKDHAGMDARDYAEASNLTALVKLLDVAIAAQTAPPKDAAGVVMHKDIVASASREAEAAPKLPPVPRAGSGAPSAAMSSTRLPGAAFSPASLRPSHLPPVHQRTGSDGSTGGSVPGQGRIQADFRASEPGTGGELYAEGGGGNATPAKQQPSRNVGSIKIEEVRSPRPNSPSSEPGSPDPVKSLFRDME